MIACRNGLQQGMIAMQQQGRPTKGKFLNAVVSGIFNKLMFITHRATAVKHNYMKFANENAKEVKSICIQIRQTLELPMLKEISNIIINFHQTSTVISEKTRNTETI